MIQKNKMFFVVKLLALFLPMQLSCSMPKETDDDRLRFFTRGNSKQGAYYQFTLNEKGFWVGTAFETVVLTIAALAQTGTKFEGFKVSVFKPKAWDFCFRWGGFLVGYQLYQLAKRNSELERLCHDRKSVEHDFSQLESERSGLLKKGDSKR